MNFRLSQRAPRQAFTLVELLTVIAIILILMGLLMGGIAGVKKTALKTEAKNDVLQIVNAVKNYNMEYGKYPTIAKSGGGGEEDAEADTMVGDPDADIQSNNSELFNTLRAIDKTGNTDHKLNPKRLVFMEGKAVKNPSQPRSGFVEKRSGGGGGGNSSEEGCFFDPWGKQYNVVIDTNYDDRIKVADKYSDFPDEDSPRTGVGAFSMGADNELGTKGDKQYRKGSTASDDVVSWIN
jgi:prepilin-type N-terminal cleavage/methylation domain-containing protein